MTTATRTVPRRGTALVVVLLAAVAGCTSGHQTTPARPAPAVVVPMGAGGASTAPITSVDGQLSVGETPWWQIPTTTPSSAGDAPTRYFTLSGGVLFQPDSPLLTAGAAIQLGVILDAAEAQHHPQITIDGHTDKGTGGSAAAAVRLSLDRADAVKNWFVAHGVPADAIVTHGWGDTRPLYPSDTDAHRAANRRCDITLTHGAR